MSIIQYKKPKQELGKHYIVELEGCEADKISFVNTVEKIFLLAAKKSKATIINYNFYQFKPQGVSGVILIAESHFTIHTWPENNYAAVDIFTCGKEMSADVAAQVLKNELGAKRMTIYILERGTNHE